MCASQRGLFVHSVGTKSQMECEFCVYKSPSLLFCLLLSAEDSNGCQNMVEFDILTLLESQARGCQFTKRKRETALLVWRPVCLTSLFLAICIICILMQSPYNSAIQSIQPLHLYACVSAPAHLKGTGGFYEVLTQWFYSARNHNEVSLHVSQHLCKVSYTKKKRSNTQFERKPQEERCR